MGGRVIGRMVTTKRQDKIPSLDWWVPCLRRLILKPTVESKPTCQVAGTRENIGGRGQLGTDPQESRVWIEGRFQGQLGFSHFWHTQCRDAQQIKFQLLAKFDRKQGRRIDPFKRGKPQADRQKVFADGTGDRTLERFEPGG